MEMNGFLSAIKNSEGDFVQFSQSSEYQIAKKRNPLTCILSFYMMFPVVKTSINNETEAIINTKFEELPILRIWQEKLIAWALKPRMVDEKNGIWICIGSGQGKTVMLMALINMADMVGGVFYLPSTRNGYNKSSLKGYNNEPIIIINQLMYHVDRSGTSKPAKSLIDVLNACAERATVIVESNQDMPPGILSNYMCIDNTENVPGI